MDTILAVVERRRRIVAGDGTPGGTHAGRDAHARYDHLGKMTDRHSVWGRVTDPDGTPVGTAEVFWVEPTDAETVGLFDVHKVAQADIEGRF